VDAMELGDEYLYRISRRLIAQDLLRSRFDLKVPGERRYGPQRLLRTERKSKTYYKGIWINFIISCLHAILSYKTSSLTLMH